MYPPCVLPTTSPAPFTWRPIPSQSPISGRSSSTAQIVSALCRGQDTQKMVLDTIGIDTETAPSVVAFMQDPASVSIAHKLGTDSALLKVIREFSYRTREFQTANENMGYEPDGCDRCFKKETIEKAEKEARDLKKGPLGCAPMGTAPAIYNPKTKTLEGGPLTHVCDSDPIEPKAMIAFFGSRFKTVLQELRIKHSYTPFGDNGPAQLMMRASGLKIVIKHLEQTRPGSPELQVLRNFYARHIDCKADGLNAFVVQQQLKGDPSRVPVPHSHGTGLDGPTYIQAFTTDPLQTTKIFQPGAKVITAKGAGMETKYTMAEGSLFERLRANVMCLFYGENPHQGPPVPLKGPRVLLSLAKVPEFAMNLNKI